MKYIHPHIYVGTVEDIDIIDHVNTSILGACKEPLHRKHARLMGASQEGYLGRAMPKTEPEYLWAEREHALYCNLIDTPDMKYIPDEIISKCLDFIEDETYYQNRHVLIVCNKAESRSPSIGFMYLISKGLFDEYDCFDSAISEFTNLYPAYKPSQGFRDYVEKFFEEHIKKIKENDNG